MEDFLKAARCVRRWSGDAIAFNGKCEYFILQGNGLQCVEGVKGYNILFYSYYFLSLSFSSSFVLVC